MPKATLQGGNLIPINDCYIELPSKRITVRSLPEIADTKSANYNDESIIGRSFPMKTYSHSENRSITITLHYYTITDKDVTTNIEELRALESVVYPRAGDGAVSYKPPPVCQIKCGKLLADEALCVVLRSYSVKFPTDVAWDEDTLLPMKYDIDTTWEVVYSSSDLPGQERIFKFGGN
jgi:hypothetical protein